VLAPLWLVQRVLPGMLARGAATIVKHGLGVGLHRPARRRLAKAAGASPTRRRSRDRAARGRARVEYRDSGLRFFNVEPGFIVTEMVKATGCSSTSARSGAARRPRCPPR
jgi:NAD(P)-dependent dehydrogenase (short-subunit alcohol dehydrogenase family)